MHYSTITIHCSSKQKLILKGFCHRKPLVRTGYEVTYLCPPLMVSKTKIKNAKINKMLKLLR